MEEQVKYMTTDQQYVVHHHHHNNGLRQLLKLFVWASVAIWLLALVILIPELFITGAAALIVFAFAFALVIIFLGRSRRR